MFCLLFFTHESIHLVVLFAFCFLPQLQLCMLCFNMLCFIKLGYFFSRFNGVVIAVPLFGETRGNGKEGEEGKKG